MTALKESLIFGKTYREDFGIHVGGWMGGNPRKGVPTRGIFSFAGEERLEDHYELGQKLGSGQFGTTYLCWEKGSRKEYACKTIPKKRLVTRGDIEDVRREVAILYHVAGHENIVEIQGVYEDPIAVHIVMELCMGGELYDAIIDNMAANNNVPYSERAAAKVGKVIARVVEICHSLGVIHRDLKPENFLLTERGPGGGQRGGVLKLADFGLSTFFKPGEAFTRHCGSPMYMAPEVVRLRSGHSEPGQRKPYGPEIDIWSAGVILYALLCGYPPFYASSQSSRDIFRLILRGRPSFSMHPWPTISASAKELIKGMLDPNPKCRPTAHQVLTHPWINEPGVAPEAALDPVIASRLRQFSAMAKLKKVAMRVIAENLREEEIAGLHEFFVLLDTDRSGTITLQELTEGLLKMGACLSTDEIQQLMKETDVDASGELEYGEFLAGTMHLSKIEKQENLLNTFRFFDRDGSGSITVDELQLACAELKIPNLSVEEMIREVDVNQDGKVDYAEFVEMMRKNNNNLGRRDLDYMATLHDMDVDLAHPKAY